MTPFEVIMFREDDETLWAVIKILRCERSRHGCKGNFQGDLCVSFFPTFPNRPAMKSIRPILHLGFLALGAFFAATHRPLEAATYWGIALAFDPFDDAQPWKERPIWQRAWLLVHLALTAAAFGLGMGWNDAA